MAHGDFSVSLASVEVGCEEVPSLTWPWTNHLLSSLLSPYS